jgi:SAM-dependent methyltransferase
MVAAGILGLLEPIRDRNGVVVELGCGSGLLTRHLVDAGHRVIATDASPAMLELAQQTAPDVDQFAQLVLPHDPIPACDAIVAVGHPFSYLPDEESIDRAFVAAAEALRPDGVLAVDISMPSPARFVRQMAGFISSPDGSWRRDDERHDNVLIDTSRLPGLLGDHQVDATVTTSFGAETLPVGLRAVIGHRLAS